MKARQGAVPVAGTVVPWQLSMNAGTRAADPLARLGSPIARSVASGALSKHALCSLICDLLCFCKGVPWHEGWSGEYRASIVSALQRTDVQAQWQPVLLAC